MDPAPTPTPQPVPGPAPSPSQSFSPPAAANHQPGFLAQTASNVGAAITDPIGGIEGFIQGTLGLPWDVANLIVPRDPNAVYPTIFGVDITKKPDILTPDTPARKGGDTIGTVVGLAGLAKGAVKLGVKFTKYFAKSADEVAETTKGYRAVSKAELEDIKDTGQLRPHPEGKSMDDKWFSETPEGAEAFKQKFPDLTETVEVEVPKSVYENAYKHPNIDGTGPGFAVPKGDLPNVKPKL